MPRGPSGDFTLAAADPVSGSVVSSSWAATVLNDLADAVGNSLARDGSGVGAGMMLVPMACADGTVTGPSFSFANEVGLGSYRKSASRWCVASGGVDVIDLNNLTGQVYTCRGAGTAGGVSFTFQTLDATGNDIATFGLLSAVGGTYTAKAKIDTYGTVHALGLTGMGTSAALTIKDANTTVSGLAHIYDTAVAHTSGKIYSWRNGGSGAELLSLSYLDATKGTFAVVGDQTISRDLAVTRNQTIGGTLGVSQGITCAGLVVSSAVTFDQSLTVGQGLVLDLPTQGDTLEVNGSATFWDGDVLIGAAKEGTPSKYLRIQVRAGYRANIGSIAADREGALLLLHDSTPGAGGRYYMYVGGSDGAWHLFTSSSGF